MRISDWSSDVCSSDLIAGGDWSGSDELFAFLERDVGDLPRGCINLEQRAVGPGIFLDRVEKCSTVRLDARRVIGPADLHLGVGGRGNRGKCESGSGQDRQSVGKGTRGAVSGNA